MGTINIMDRFIYIILMFVVFSLDTYSIDYNQYDIGQQLLPPEELFNKIQEPKRSIRSSNNNQKQTNIYHQPQVKYSGSNVDKDFNIYNFERIDYEISDIRSSNTYLTEEISAIREREKTYIEVIEGLLTKSKRYDHFFRKWDDLKDSFNSIWVAGGGSMITGILGFLGIFLQRRRRIKKEGLNKK